MTSPSRRSAAGIAANRYDARKLSDVNLAISAADDYPNVISTFVSGHKVASTPRNTGRKAVVRLNTETPTESSAARQKFG
jgi:hypothetical protein